MITFVFAVRFTAYLAKYKGFLSLGFFHIRLALEHQKIGKIDAAQARVMARIPQFQMDMTKRKSLMPSNQVHVPANWELVKGTDKESLIPHQTDPTKRRVGNLPVTAPIPTTFIHDFFGSQLTIGDMVIGKGLAKKKHRLEITHDQLTIDSVPQDVNQGELERIKQIIRENRK